MSNPIDNYHCWFFVMIYLTPGDDESAETISTYVRTKTDCGLTVAQQLVDSYGEGYKLTELSYCGTIEDLE